ncbi:MAG: DUF2279 domain-containing protein [Rhodothermales bacterium]|nr:DUF2279 domain-containing protein [Rhodothermales bacterium]
MFDIVRISGVRQARRVRRSAAEAPRGALLGLFLALALPAASQAQRLVEPLPLLSDSVGVTLTGLPVPDTVTAPAPHVPPEPEIDRWRMAAVTGLSVGGGLAVLETQRRRWWAERSPHFRIQNDWAYVRWADKFGHIYSSAFFTRYYRTAFGWAGMSEGEARWWGAGAAWTQMLYYEVLDGFGVQWGFSPGDVLFNTIGVGWTTAQDLVPVLDEAFAYKVSYWPSGWEGKNFTDDYAGQTFWLTANPNRLAPDAAKPFLPPWLNVAVGYGARERDEIDFLTESHLYVGLDFEPTALPLEGPVWDAVLGALHYIHLPAPAIRLAPEPRLVLLAY